MTDKEHAGPPPLEDPNSRDYVCVYCQSNVDALCLECQELAQLTANFTRNDRDDSDRDTPLDIDDESQNYDRHMLHHEDPESPVYSDTSDSAYYADTIIDSPTSTDTTLDLNDIENVDETSTGARNVSDCRISSERADLSAFCASYSNLDETCTRARNVILYGATMKGLKFKPLILDGRFERDSDSETDDSDMPPLEERKKNKEDSDEDCDDMSPLEEK